MEARALRVFGHALDREFCMSERTGKTLHRHFVRGHRRPLVAAGQAAREDTHVVGVVRDRKRHGAQVVERSRGMERSDDPAVPFRDQA
jgi:hypothetical protein